VPARFRRGWVFQPWLECGVPSRWAHQISSYSLPLIFALTFSTLFNASTGQGFWEQMELNDQLKKPCLVREKTGQGRADRSNKLGI
jgi:hypothetical protein